MAAHEVPRPRGCARHRRPKAPHQPNPCLDLHAVVAAKMHKVVALHQLVRKLGERQPRLRIQSSPDAVLGQHGAHTRVPPCGTTSLEGRGAVLAQGVTPALAAHCVGWQGLPSIRPIIPLAPLLPTPAPSPLLQRPHAPQPVRGKSRAHAHTPTSRRKSSTPMSFHQSWLSTIAGSGAAAVPVGQGGTRCSRPRTSAAMQAALASTTASSSSGRSADLPARGCLGAGAVKKGKVHGGLRRQRRPFLRCHDGAGPAVPRHSAAPDGSPMRPVAPPMSATTPCPVCWNQASAMRHTRLPKCSDSAVGSNPQYTTSGARAAAAANAASSPAKSASRPRSLSTRSVLARRAAARSSLVPAASRPGPAAADSPARVPGPAHAAALRGRAWVPVGEPKECQALAGSGAGSGMPGQARTPTPKKGGLTLRARPSTPPLQNPRFPSQSAFQQGPWAWPHLCSAAWRGACPAGGSWGGASRRHALTMRGTHRLICMEGRARPRSAARAQDHKPQQLIKKYTQQQCMQGPGAFVETPSC